MSEAAQTPEAAPRVGLFVTCIVDLFRPNVGFAAVKLLEDAGCRVAVPDLQVCCGQPAWNSGDRADTMALASRVVDAFEPFDYVVGRRDADHGHGVTVQRDGVAEPVKPEAEPVKKAV